MRDPGNSHDPADACDRTNEDPHSDVPEALAALREFVADPSVRTGAPVAEWTEREARLRRAFEADTARAYADGVGDSIPIDQAWTAAVEVWDQTTGRDLLAALNRNVNRKTIYQAARAEFVAAVKARLGR